MNDQQLMRMALVLQNQAATSLEKNLCSIVTVVLLDSQESKLSIDTIAERIKEKFSLDFDCGEIRNAIIKKGNGSVTLDNIGASLTTPARLRFEREDTLQQRLSLSISRFMSEYSLKADFNFENLVVSYIYHSFNTNTNNLLYLLKYRSIPEDAKFNATNEEICALNAFLNWEDKEKNEIIYILVSVCFEYCMLTVKKDELLSLKLFQGKRFYLDANIIFQMTGVHTDERKYVTSMFIKKCQEVKIELLYTDETFDEISRVINSQVECIQSLTEGQAPLSAETLQKLSASYRINDFYRLYYAWCQVRGNNFSDSEAFRCYLFDLTRSVTQGLKYADTSNLTMTQSVEHDNACKSLSDYKEKSKRRKPTESSVKTDISNILYIKKKRINPQGSIWDTNDFLVSADQHLITWAKAQFAGVPLVVLPSVFMSIILRFTGRTDDDYSAFNRFMTLRTNDYQAFDIDINSFIHILNKKSSEIEIKERIIDEVVRNRDQYTFNTEDDYEESTEKAFDAILQKESEEHRKQLLEIKKRLEEAEQKVPDEVAIRISEKEKIRRLAIQKQTEKEFQGIKKAKARTQKWFFVLPTTVALLFISFLIVWAGNSPAAMVIDSFFSKRFDSFGTKVGYVALIGMPVTTLLSIAYKKVEILLFSDDQLRNKRNKIEKRITKEIDSYLS